MNRGLTIALTVTLLPEQYSAAYVNYRYADAHLCSSLTYYLSTPVRPYQYVTVWFPPIASGLELFAVLTQYVHVHSSLRF